MQIGISFCTFHKGGCMRSLALGMMVLMLAFGSSSAKIHSWKGAVHLSAVPFIAASGIYSDVWMLHDAQRNGTKAGAITNLSLLGIQAGLGATILFTNDDLPPAVRVIHRIVGAGVIASALWISIAGTRDPGVANLTRNIAYTHTILAAAPLILFTF
jgi:heme A synthase